MEAITDQSTLDSILAEGSAVLLKHGARCPISAHARDEVASFAAAHPDVPVYSLEVTEHRALAERVAERLGLRHESPQLIVVRDGRPAWHAAHYDIAASSLTRHAPGSASGG
jgi:bacillithiol system protein YtxJ